MPDKFGTLIAAMAALAAVTFALNELISILCVAALDCKDTMFTLAAATRLVLTKMAALAAVMLACNALISVVWVAALAFAYA